MGDDGGMNAKEGIGSIMNAMRAYYPEMVQLYGQGLKQAAGDEFSVAQQYTPGYAQLAADTMANQGKKLAQTGREIASADTAAAGKAELDLMSGTGTDMARKGLALQQEADPEFFAQQKKLAANTDRLMSSMDPTRLSTGEIEQIARGLGRLNYNVNSPAQASMNAMAFGDRLANRRNEYAGYLGQQASVMPQLRSGLNMPALATQRQTPGVNVGLSQMPGISTPGMSSAANSFSGFMSPANAAMQINMNKQASDWQKYGMATKAVGDTIGIVGNVAMAAGGACWVAREVYGVYDQRWLLFRTWLMTKAPRWLYSTYMKYGEKFAAWLHTHAWAKPFIKSLMDLAI